MASSGARCGATVVRRNAAVRIVDKSARREVEGRDQTCATEAELDVGFMNPPNVRDWASAWDTNGCGRPVRLPVRNDPFASHRKIRTDQDRVGDGPAPKADGATFIDVIIPELLARYERRAAGTPPLEEAAPTSWELQPNSMRRKMHGALKRGSERRGDSYASARSRRGAGM